MRHLRVVAERQMFPPAGKFEGASNYGGISQGFEVWSFPIRSGDQCSSFAVAMAAVSPPIGEAPLVLPQPFVEFTANRFPLLKR